MRSAVDSLAGHQARQIRTRQKEGDAVLVLAMVLAAGSIVGRRALHLLEPPVGEWA